ncbi:MAG: alpha/beta hydrolase [Caulobacteraceae bacterium]
MPRASNGAVEIEYQTFGDPAGEAVLLINGLGSQMTRWPEPFCSLLVKRGLFPIRFDNRDTGLSSWCESQGYNVDDMAADAAAVLDAVGKAEGAHRRRVDGGMIAQVFAANYPDRTLSLTSIMSNTAIPMRRRRMSSCSTRAHLIPASRTSSPTRWPGPRAIGSPGYPWPPGALAARAKAEADRAFNPAGVQRQMAAIRAGGDRRPKLATIKAPTMGAARHRRSAGASRRRPRHSREYRRRRAAHRARHGPRPAAGALRHLHRNHLAGRRTRPRQSCCLGTTAMADDAPKLITACSPRTSTPTPPTRPRTTMRACTSTCSITGPRSAAGSASATAQRGLRRDERLRLSAGRSGRLHVRAAANRQQ